MLISSLVLLLLSACSGDTPKDPADADADSGAPEPTWAEPARCDDVVSPADSDALIRWPYVQWVTDDAATIAWGTAADAGAASAAVELGRDDSYGVAGAEASHQDIPYTDEIVIALHFGS